MSDSKVSVDLGIGFSGLLTVLLVGLKLGHVINWGWVWILSPLWIGAILVLIVTVILLFIDALT